jgi:phosphoenolpyruvate carboxykinase (ATP)
MKLEHTRAMVRAIFNGELDEAATREDPIFGIDVPVRVAGVPEPVLHPRETWKDRDAYDVQARKLAAMFRRNFESLEGEIPRALRQGGPRS